MSTTHYTDVKVTPREHSECTIEASVPADVFATYRNKALTALGKDVEVPGFRKGHVPEDMLVQHIGEGKILERAANMALADVYPRIVTEQNIDAIGSPHIQITKLAAGNPLSFSATTAVMPEVTLPDYAAIAKKTFGAEEKELSVTDDELNETLLHIRRQRSHIDHVEAQKTGETQEPPAEIPDEELPELTDEFVKTLGDFETVAAFSEKVRENLLEEKRLRERDKKRITTVETIVKEAAIDLPRLLVDQEIARIRAHVEGQVAQTGTSFDDYVKNLGKTREELEDEWKPEAEKRAKLQLILNRIAKEQGIAPDADAVAQEVTHLTAQYPEADAENVRVYVETTKRNEAVFAWLEAQNGSLATP